MHSKKNKTAYVWVWLPKHTEPVVAGKLTQQNQYYIFNYGQSYLQKKDAISLHEPELPLKKGEIFPKENLIIANCIRDASPDAWGRRIILNRHYGKQSLFIDPVELNELDYLLESGSDRIGALDFQISSSHYEPRHTASATLEELLDSAARVEQGIPLTPALDQALFHGTSIGGARPKAFIEYNNKKYIAKFSASTDLYNIVKLEFLAMHLAQRVGLQVPDIQLVQAAHKDVLLIERFDRIFTETGWQKKGMLSALTLLQLDEMMARYASYEKLAELIRYSFAQPKATLKELFSRLVFNILIGNTDDHARNHAAFWDGNNLSLTPAYDLCPQHRVGTIASQAMLILGPKRNSQLSVCLEAAPHFLLSTIEADAIIQEQIDVIQSSWHEVCDLAQLTTIEKNYFWKKQFLNPYAFE